MGFPNQVLVSYLNRWVGGWDMDFYIFQSLVNVGDRLLGGGGGGGGGVLVE